MQLVSAGGAVVATVAVIPHALVGHQPMICKPLFSRARKRAQVAAVLDAVVHGEPVEGKLVVARAAEGTVLAGESVARS